MEDLIIIILTLIVAVVGSLGQIRKRKQQGQSNGGEQHEPQGFWEMLEGQDREQEMEYFEPVESHKPVQAPVVETGNAPVPNQFDLEGQPIHKDKAGNIKDGIKADDLTGISDIAESKARARKKFPLRKAVIYSEILNRKYT